MRADPGAQPERTRLAWRRTTLTFAVVVLLAARVLVVSDGVPARRAVWIALLALVWTFFLGVAHRRMEALTRDRPPGAAPASLFAAAAAVGLAAVLLALAA
ncbi:DUF202 domain-containing protein [Streptomyces hoynatensis]|uniref:DUF202 domain-containing protein n=1 Tax=Streptomyces hoynatensis TaxID=1141874 RepID=A0A3A9Z7I5_9ACTN|nr:DUF202 domain-containing protein [Streptomyces hoynatensis]RKN43834.1 DUF202 domain-containing protein [Streptomyces hoynatensis]